jgi:lipopolysaccharide biosynthesis glycosyltransferase
MLMAVLGFRPLAYLLLLLAGCRYQAAHIPSRSFGRRQGTAIDLQPIQEQPTYVSEDKEIHLVYGCRDSYPGRPEDKEDAGRVYYQYATETLRSMFSVVLFSSPKRRNIHFHVLADKNCAARVKNEVEQVPIFYPNTMHLHMHDMNDLIKAINTLPQAKGFLSGDGPGEEALKLAARVKVFLPMLDAFKSIDKLIMIDSDTIVGADISLLWDLFNDFTPDQQLGIAAEQDQFFCNGWYTRKNTMSKLAYFKPHGLNGGVILMDLAKMRTMKTVENMLRIMSKHGAANFVLGDQDLWNVYGFENPAHVYVLPCVWNVRGDSKCPHQSEYQIIHGSRWQIHHINTVAGKANREVRASIAMPLSDLGGRAALRVRIREIFPGLGPNQPWPGTMGTCKDTQIECGDPCDLTWEQQSSSSALPI